MFEQITKMHNALHECLKAMDGFSGSEFMSIICMMMEEVCEANGLDVVEMAEIAQIMQENGRKSP